MIIVQGSGGFQECSTESSIVVLQKGMGREELGLLEKVPLACHKGLALSTLRHCCSPPTIEHGTRLCTYIGWLLKGGITTYMITY